MHSQTISRLSILAVTLVFGGTGLAIESDKEQDVIYSSVGRSTSRVEGNARIITLEDEVKVTQGTLEITGDSAVFERDLDSNEIRKITVSGSPARYRQQLEIDGTTIEGDSAAIYYYVEVETVVEFVGSANLRQQNDTLSCVSIKYFPDTGFTEYTGPCKGVLSRPNL